MIQEQSQTHSAFAEAYQMSKIFSFANDNWWDKLFRSKTNPVSYKKESRMLSDSEWEGIKQQCESLNIKL